MYIKPTHNKPTPPRATGLSLSCQHRRKKTNLNLNSSDNTPDTAQNPAADGSNNNPEPPVPVDLPREPESVLRACYLEVPSGSDVVEAIFEHSRRMNVNMCVLDGKGDVTDITLSLPNIAPGGATGVFPGRYRIRSMSASFSPQQPLAESLEGFCVALDGPQGGVGRLHGIFTGCVLGHLTAAGRVLVIAASFKDPSCPGLQWEEDAQSSDSGSGSASSDGESTTASGGAGET